MQAAVIVSELGPVCIAAVTMAYGHCYALHDNPPVISTDVQLAPNKKHQKCLTCSSIISPLGSTVTTK